MPVKDMVVAEMLMNILMLEKGKISILPFPFFLRQSKTSQHGDMLVAGNSFLERCISVDAFSDFNSLVEKNLVSLNDKQKKRVLKAIAGWLQLFLVNIYIGNIRI